MHKKERPALAGNRADQNIFTVNYNSNSPWMTSDRRWFEDHPDRAHRIREVMSGELLEVDHLPFAASHAVIRQSADGRRIRVMCCLPSLPDGYKSKDADLLIHALFDVLITPGPDLSGGVSFEDLLAHFEALQAAREVLQ